MWISCLALQQRLEVGAGDGGGVGGYLLGGALRDYEASSAAAFGAEVEEVIDGLEDVEVVLDDDDGVAAVNELLEDAEKNLDVLGVEAGGWLVEDVEGLAGGFLGELGGKLHALALAAGKRDGRLTEGYVAETDVKQGLELHRDGGNRSEELVCL